MERANEMSKLTITEALQEIKTIGKRLEKKRQSIAQYVARDIRVRDPLEKDGGSEKFITQERQAIADLESRVISIRTSIQRSNLDSPLTVGQKTMKVADWLTWRREVAAGRKSFIGSLIGGINNFRNEVQKKGGRVVAAAVAVNEAAGPNDPPQIVINVDELALMREQEEIEDILGTLDGKLSLFNATTVIEA
jgi:hypothetical protein